MQEEEWKGVRLLPLVGRVKMCSSAQCRGDTLGTGRTRASLLWSLHVISQTSQFIT